MQTALLNDITESTTYFEPLIDSKQAAALLGIHWKTVQELARSGQMPSHRIGNLWRFRASEMDNWLKGRLTSISQSACVN